MLDHKMITIAYPMLLRLMGEYGHSMVELNMEKAVKYVVDDKPIAIRVEIRQDGTIKLYFNGSRQMDSSIGAKVKRCPILNFFVNSNMWMAESNMYVRYCGLIVSEIEKYKKLENEAYQVIERIDAFNLPLTRSVITEKTKK